MPTTIRSQMTVLLTVCLLFTASVAVAQSYLDLENQIQEFTLENGIKFIVLENHDVPVFSFRTWVNAGSANEVRGITGIAHILEHMAFKGTSEIGTTDYKKESKAMAAEDDAFAALKAERNKGVQADEAKLAELTADLGQEGWRIPAGVRDFLGRMFPGTESAS